MHTTAKQAERGRVQQISGALDKLQNNFFLGSYQPSWVEVAGTEGRWVMLEGGSVCKVLDLHVLELSLIPRVQIKILSAVVHVCHPST